MPTTELILTIAVWLTAVAAFVFYWRRAGAGISPISQSGKVRKP